jgi:hypothetical protein
LKTAAPCVQGFLLGEYQGRNAWIVSFAIDRTGVKDDTVAVPADIAARFGNETKVIVSDVIAMCPAEQTAETQRFAYWPRDPEVDGWP